jgi:hypothetical protein
VALSDPNVSRSEGEDVTFGNETSFHGTAFCEATPYSLAEVYRYSDVSYCHYRPTFCFRPEVEAAGSSEPPTHMYRITRLHIPPGFTFIVTVVRNQNPRKSVHFNNNFSLNSYLQRLLSTIFFSQKRPFCLWSSPFIVFIGYKGTLSGVKLQLTDCDYLFLYSAEIKNEQR